MILTKIITAQKRPYPYNHGSLVSDAEINPVLFTGKLVVLVVQPHKGTTLFLERKNLPRIEFDRTRNSHDCRIRINFDNSQNLFFHATTVGAVNLK